MCAKAGVPTWLAWVFFTDDPYWPEPNRFSAPLAKRSLLRVFSAVGLPSQHPLCDRIGAVYLPPSPTGALSSDSLINELEGADEAAVVSPGHRQGLDARTFGGPGWPQSGDAADRSDPATAE